MKKIRAYLGRLPEIDKTAYIDDDAVVIGQVKIGAQSSLFPYVVVRADVNKIQIGSRTNIQDACILHVSRPKIGNPQGYPLIIGDEVTVGHHATLHGCRIGNRVLVGMGSIILDGAMIEEEVMIGAGSLVPPGQRLHSGYLYVGSPAKQSRPLKDSERRFLVDSAQNYVELSQDYQQSNTEHSATTPPTYTVTQMQHYEREQSLLGVSYTQLMENAGQGVADDILKRFGHRQNVLIVCGCGNNGGDGLVVARLLAEAGHCVDIITPTNGFKSTLAKHNFERLPETIRRISWEAVVMRECSYHLIVEALYGTRFSGSLNTETQKLILYLNQYHAIRIALDMPAGIESDSGKVAPGTFCADITYAFGAYKPAHHLPTSAQYCGEVVWIDIGL